MKMEQLNILVGPNGSGKSNFIEAIALLRSAATKLTTPIREKGGGGVAEWIWKGKPNGTATIEATVMLDGERDFIKHSIEFAAESQRFVLLDERIGKDVIYTSQPDGYYFYRILRGTPLLMIQDRGDERYMELKDVSQDESILSQRRDP
jgi:predicted ATPase